MDLGHVSLVAVFSVLYHFVCAGIDWFQMHTHDLSIRTRRVTRLLHALLRIHLIGSFNLLQRQKHFVLLGR